MMNELGELIAQIGGNVVGAINGQNFVDKAGLVVVGQIVVQICRYHVKRAHKVADHEKHDEKEEIDGYAAHPFDFIGLFLPLRFGLGDVFADFVDKVGLQTRVRVYRVLQYDAQRIVDLIRFAIRFSRSIYLDTLVVSTLRSRVDRRCRLMVRRRCHRDLAFDAERFGALVRLARLPLILEQLLTLRLLAQVVFQALVDASRRLVDLARPKQRTKRAGHLFRRLSE